MTTKIKERDLLSRISINPQICGGRPCIKGHRIAVEQILDLLSCGLSPQEIRFDWFPTLRLADVYAAIAFASQSVRNEELAAHRR